VNLVSMKIVSLKGEKMISKINICKRESKAKQQIKQSINDKFSNDVVNAIVKMHKDSQASKSKKKLHCAKINVLGQPYSVKIQNSKQCPALTRINGYCDDTTHEIVVADLEQETANLVDVKGDLSIQMNRIMCHEIIHAFLFESGIAENCGWDGAYNEEVVDWIAWQLPKIIVECQKVKAL